MVSNTDLEHLSDWLSESIILVRDDPPEPTEIEIKKGQLVEWGFDYDSELEEWIKTQWLEKVLELGNLPDEVTNEFKDQIVAAGFETLRPTLDLLNSEMNFDKLELGEELLASSLTYCKSIIPEDPPTKDNTWDEWLEENDLATWWQQEDE